VNNLAYIDGQNLFLGTTKRVHLPWAVDLKRFRIYLERKYDVEKAYYYLGFVQDGEVFESLYEKIQNAGFILVFREHNSAMLGKKKGNVDSDIIFSIMKRLYRREPFDKIVLVSGDGDYKMMVEFLIEENRFEKILFPDQKRASSLYKTIGAQYFSDLSNVDIRRKVEVEKEKGSLGN